MRVLIVDDEPLARAALEKILTANPDVERFDSANDAIEAQQRLSNENYDVVLLDISMPELSGLELIARLQEYPRPLPSVVFVTAHAEHAVAAFEKHAVDYILKPFSSDRVNRAIEFASHRTASERTARLIEIDASASNPEAAPSLEDRNQKQRTNSFRRSSRYRVGASGRKLCFVAP